LIISIAFFPTSNARQIIMEQSCRYNIVGLQLRTGIQNKYLNFEVKKLERMN